MWKIAPPENSGTIVMEEEWINPGLVGLRKCGLCHESIMYTLPFVILVMGANAVGYSIVLN